MFTHYFNFVMWDLYALRTALRNKFLVLRVFLSILYEPILLSLRAGSLSVLFMQVFWCRKSASEASRREEWGEEKWACTKAVEIWIPPLWGDKSQLSRYQISNQYKRSKMLTNTTANFHTREDWVLYECAGIAQKKIINTVDNFRRI